MGMLMLWETLMEESLVDTLMLTPTENSSRFSILLMEQDSVLLTLVSPLLPRLTQSLLLLPPSTQSLSLPQYTLVLLLNQLLTPLRLLKLRLLTLLLLLLLLPPLRGRDVRLMLLFLEELPGSSLLPPPSSTTHQCVPMLPILMLVLVTMDLAMLVLVTMVLVMLGFICKPHFKFYLKDSGLSSLLCM